MFRNLVIVMGMGFLAATLLPLFPYPEPSELETISGRLSIRHSFSCNGSDRWGKMARRGDCFEIDDRVLPCLTGGLSMFDFNQTSCPISPAAQEMLSAHYDGREWTSPPLENAKVRYHRRYGVFDVYVDGKPLPGYGSYEEAIKRFRKGFINWVSSSFVFVLYVLFAFMYVRWFRSNRH